MRLQITSKNQDTEYFIRDYLLPKIKKLYILGVNLDKLEKYDKLLNVNSYNVLLYYISHLNVSKIGNDRYIIKPNDYFQLYDKPISYYINFITYGNLTTGGYKIIPDIFKYVRDNINDIYEDYLSECQILW